METDPPATKVEEQNQENKIELIAVTLPQATKNEIQAAAAHSIHRHCPAATLRSKPRSQKHKKIKHFHNPETQIRFWEKGFEEKHTMAKGMSMARDPPESFQRK